MKRGRKFSFATILIAVLLAIFCEASCPFMSEKTAEAGEMSINYADTAESFTVSVISVEESTMLGRLWKFFVGAVALVLVIVGLVFIFSGGWLLIVIVAVIYYLGRYIITGEQP